MAAPIGGLLWAFAAFVGRISFHFIWAKVKGHRFAALDRPGYVNDAVTGSGDDVGDEYRHTRLSVEASRGSKFF